MEEPNFGAFGANWVGIWVGEESRIGRDGVGNVERYFQHGLELQFGEWHGTRCPPVLGTRIEYQRS